MKFMSRHCTLFCIPHLCLPPGKRGVIHPTKKRARNTLATRFPLPLLQVSTLGITMNMYLSTTRNVISGQLRGQSSCPIEQSSHVSIGVRCAFHGPIPTRRKGEPQEHPEQQTTSRQSLLQRGSCLERVKILQGDCLHSNARTRTAYRVASSVYRLSGAHMQCASA